MARPLERRRYRRSEPLSRARLARSLGAGLRLGAARCQRLERTYLDSFDWRLYRAGGVLEEQRTAEGPTLVWRELSSGEPIAELPGQAAPRFASELPGGELRKQLGRLIERRALLPWAVVRLETEVLPVYGAEGAALAQITLERGSVRGFRMQEEQPLPERVELRAERGQRRAFRELNRVLTALGLAREEGDPLVLALAGAGLRAGESGAKPRIALDPAAPAPVAVRSLLLPFFEALEANEEGVLLDWDSEFLHDFRVALRRARSTAKLLSPLLPPEGEALQSELTWLARLTGPARDGDVQALRLPDYLESLPEALRPGLSPIAEHVERGRAEARRRLLDALSSPRYRALLRGWRKLLEAVPAGAGSASVGELASASLADLHRRVLRRGEGIGPEAPSERLHDLRKRCKELRYAIESFRSLYPEKSVARALRSLKGLQDALGRFQDDEVQIADLTRLAQELRGTPEMGRALLAIGALLEVLDRKRRKAIEAAVERFARFSNERVAAVFAAPAGPPSG